ncbi:hypothetical protein BDQ17DRAFT_1258660, partial [Cyathus striatus]
IIIFSNSGNTVSLFNSLGTSSIPLNHLLKLAIDILLCEGYQLHVLHLPGEHNYVADALSCRQFDKAQLHNPALSLQLFQPPHNVLGALKK